MVGLVIQLRRRASESAAARTIAAPAARNGHHGTWVALVLGAATGAVVVSVPGVLR
jgi:hypothetical protein